MDDLAFVRERIESYADYTIDTDRQRSDEQIRAYVGEALARLLERLQPTGHAGEVLSSVLLRCQFADQAVARALETDDVKPPEIAAIHGADRDLVVLADQADSIGAAAVAAYVGQIDAAFNRRSEIVMSDAVTAPPMTPI